MIAHHAAQQCVHRQALYLAFQIPQRQIEGSQRVFLFSPRRVKERARHVLPEPLDVMRIASDQAAGALLQHLLGAAFADSRDAGVGLYGHHQVALVVERVRVRRRIDAHAGDLHLRHRRLTAGNSDDARGRHRRERTQEGSTIHDGDVITEPVVLR